VLAGAHGGGCDRDDGHDRVRDRARDDHDHGCGSRVSADRDSWCSRFSGVVGRVLAFHESGPWANAPS
jgi:hypothetical protein